MVIEQRDVAVEGRDSLAFGSCWKNAFSSRSCSLGVRGLTGVKPSGSGRFGDWLWRGSELGIGAMYLLSALNLVTRAPVLGVQGAALSWVVSTNAEGLGPMYSDGMICNEVLSVVFFGVLFAVLFFAPFVALKVELMGVSCFVSFLTLLFGFTVFFDRGCLGFGTLGGFALIFSNALAFAS